jgi:bifunctional non-homologous end joining protein LigD
MRRRRSNPARVTKATGRLQKPGARPPGKSPLLGRAPLGSLPAGRGRSAASSTLPEFIPFALCQLVDRPPNGPDWVHEIKLDGWRVQVRVENGRATIRTRKGLDYTGTFPEIAQAARGLDNYIMDGEICVVGKDSLTDFSALQAAMKGDRTEKLILFAFDLLWLGDEDLRAQPLIVRKKRLRDFLEENKDQELIRFIDHLDATGSDVMDTACDMKLEGIISKRLTDPYVSGRTVSWTKAKCRATQRPNELTFGHVGKYIIRG